MNNVQGKTRSFFSFFKKLFQGAIVVRTMVYNRMMNLDFSPAGLLFDLDGTLLDDKKVLRPELKEILKKLRKMGLKIGVATGRQYFHLKEKVLPDFMIEDWHVISGGAEVISNAGEVKWGHYLETQTVQKIFARLEQWGMKLVFGQNDRGYINDVSLARPEFVKKGIVREPLMAGLENWQTPLLVIDDLNEEGEAEIAQMMQEEWAQELNWKKMTHSVKTPAKSQYYYDVTPQGINKSVGAKVWAETVGADLRQVIAFGDNQNDVELLQAVGCGVVMAHGTEAALQVADIVIEGVEKGGLQEFLQKLIKS